MNPTNNTINAIKNIGGTAAAPTILSTLKSALGPIANFAGSCEILMPIVIIPLPVPDIPGQTGKT